jgi:hypothetical protein
MWESLLHNCRAQIYRGTDQLSGGQRVSTNNVLLLAAPAYISAPRRSWEQMGAVEGGFAGTLHVHTQTNLNPATSVTIEGHQLAGTYEVVGVRLTSREWALSLERRP